MKNLKFLNWILRGCSGLVGLLLIFGLVRQCAPEVDNGQVNDRIAYDAVVPAVDKRVNELMEETAEERAQAEIATRETAKNQAHAKVLETLSMYRQLYSQLDCNRAEALHKKVLDAEATDRVGAYTQINQMMIDQQQRIKQWANDYNGGLMGDAEAIAEARAAIGDAIATLELLNDHYTQTRDVCDEGVQVEVRQFAETVTAVAADFDTDQQLAIGEGQQDALVILISQYRTDPTADLYRDIVAIAKAREIDLREYGLE